MTQRLVMLGEDHVVGCEPGPGGVSVMRLALRAVAPRPPAPLSLLEDD